MTTRRPLLAPILAVLLLAGFGQAAQAHAGPHTFARGKTMVAVASDGDGVEFLGEVERVVSFSDTEADAYTLSLRGKLFLSSGGCATIKVEYVDLNGQVQEVDDAGSVIKQFATPGVASTEIDDVIGSGKSHLDVRVLLQHGPTCQDLATVAETTTALPYAPPNLGAGPVVFVKEETRERQPPGATIDIASHLGVVSNDVGVDDEVFAYVHGHIEWWLSPEQLAPPRCYQLEAIAFAEDREEIERQWMGASCDRRETSLGSAFFRSPKIDRIVVRLHTHEIHDDGIVSSVSHGGYFHLHS